MNTIVSEHPSHPIVIRANAARDPDRWLEENRPWLDEEAQRHGSVLLRGFAFSEAARFQHFFRKAFGELLEYRERSSPRRQVEGKIYTSTEYPPDQPIFLHNENSYQHEFPLKIGFYCSVPPSDRGATPIADVRRVLGRLLPATRRKFEQLGVMYVRNFDEGFGLSWHDVFQTTDRAEVDAYCALRGIQAEWKADGALRTRTVRPAIARHPTTGEEAWFNHAAFFHVSTLPELVREELLLEFASDDLPMNSYYGNGEEIAGVTLDELRSAYRAETARFDWEADDVLLLDNVLVAHAREPYSGPRRILVAMAQARTR